MATLSFLKLFQPLQLAATNGAIYTMLTTPSTIVMKNGRVRLVNTSASPVAVTLYAVPSGGTASATNMFLSAESIAPYGRIDVDVPDLSAGDVLSGFASTASVVSVHGMGGVLYS